MELAFIIVLVAQLWPRDRQSAILSTIARSWRLGRLLVGGEPSSLPSSGAAFRPGTHVGAGPKQELGRENGPTVMWEDCPGTKRL